MSQDHSAAAVPVQAEFVKCLTLDSLLGLIIVSLVANGDTSLLVSLDLLDKIDVEVVFVANNLK